MNSSDELTSGYSWDDEPEGSVGRPKGVPEAVWDEESDEYTLAAIARNGNGKVRAAVCSLPWCPPFVLKQHVSDPNENVVFSVLTNENVPLDVVKLAREDKRGRVRYWADAVWHARKDMGR